MTYYGKRKPREKKKKENPEILLLVLRIFTRDKSPCLTNYADLLLKYQPSRVRNQPAKCIQIYTNLDWTATLGPSISLLT